MRVANLDGRTVLVGGPGAVDVERASGGGIRAAPEAVFEQWGALGELHRAVDYESAARPFDPARLRAPVEGPSQVFAVALNYRPHAAEAGYVEPEAPLIFTKFPTCITGPRDAVELPDGHVDWEAELVAVVGRPAYRVGREDAWEVLAGVTVGQDISERVSQLSGTPAQFSLGKSFPGFGPIGPAIVTPDELPDRDDLGLLTEVSGERMQQDRTAGMIFDVAGLVAYLSATCRLLPGDLIFTGTPAGVGNRMSPQRFLRPGDLLVTEIEGVGRLENRMVERR